MEEKKFGEIFKNHIKKCGFTQKELGEALGGMKQGQVNNIITGRERLGLKNAQRFADVLGIDPLWLMTKGEQGTPPDSLPTTTGGKDVRATYEINFDSMGGWRANEAADIAQYAVGVWYFPKDVAHEGDIVVPVSGDSMAPRYPSGSKLLIRPLPMWREWLELGRPYVLELADWRRLLKIVRKGSSPDTLTLDSVNPKYDASEINKTFIEHVWMVVLSFNKEVL